MIVSEMSVMDIVFIMGGVSILSFVPVDFFRRKAQKLVQITLSFLGVKSKKDMGKIGDLHYTITALLYLLAASDGEVRPDEERRISDQIETYITVDRAELNELKSFGKLTASHYSGKPTALREWIVRIHELAPNIGEDLLSMINAIEFDCGAEAHARVYADIKLLF